jgi:4-alpha-glucanotransferase
VPNAIVYSGTHDNNTTVGWWEDEMDEGARHFMRMYLERDVQEANWVLIQIGMMSVGHTFIAPMQDILGLGTEARMNKPGQPAGNWTWRFMPDVLENQQIRGRLAHYTGIYQRRPDQQEREYGDPAERPAQ